MAHWTVSVLTILWWAAVFSNSQAVWRAAIWDSSPVTFWSYWCFSLKICCCSLFLSSSRPDCLREIKNTTLTKRYFEALTRIRHHSMRLRLKLKQHYSFGSSVMHSHTDTSLGDKQQENTWVTKPQRYESLWQCWRLILVSETSCNILTNFWIFRSCSAAASLLFSNASVAICSFCSSSLF